LFVEAIGLSTSSNSKAGVSSYVAIFENLWRQTELYEQLEESNKQLTEANEQLKRHDKMQEEFINIAAHELRTPIQPILGLSDVLLSKKGDIEQYKELLDAIKRSSKRLQRLTEDILDVTRIESQSLYLKEEQFNPNDVITNVINDTLTSADPSLKKESNNTSLIKLEHCHSQNIIIQADKGRITQVISNLLSNAIKFTQKGMISISLERKKDDNDNNNDYVVISVRDTGRGIGPEIFPKLFSKFASTSKTGTGLGLFISKSIVEAHGGKIWAKNNTHGKGATFAFSLPIVNR
jgi:two-component system sensor histidine kinase VicK